jgi:hypothetical protein
MDGQFRGHRRLGLRRHLILLVAGYYWWQAADTAIWHQEILATGAWGVPSIAWTGSSVVIAIAANDGNLYYWWQQAGTATWQQETVATGSYSDSIPSIAWTGSSVVITATANDGTLNYWWQAAGTVPWLQETVATGNYASASIAWTGSSTVIAAAGGTGGLYYWWQAADTAPWHQETVATTGGWTAPSIAWIRSTIVDDPVRWTLVDELGVGHPVQLALNDFLEVSLERVETAVAMDEQPALLWERDG